MDLAALLVGSVSALAISVFATAVRLDRDRAFYPTVMIVIALLYELFAAIGGSIRAALHEAIFAVGFVGFTVLGFKRNLWWVAAMLFLHGCFDSVHHRVIANPGVPEWWPEFCGSYDIVAALYLGVLLKLGRLRAKPN